MREAPEATWNRVVVPGPKVTVSPPNTARPPEKDDVAIGSVSSRNDSGSHSASRSDGVPGPLLVFWNVTEVSVSGCALRFWRLNWNTVIPDSPGSRTPAV